jgi:hypothetical protein
MAEHNLVVLGFGGPWTLTFGFGGPPEPPPTPPAEGVLDTVLGQASGGLKASTKRPQGLEV